MINNVELDGEPTVVDIQTPSIKLRENPSLVIAIPCGDKEDNTLLTCPKHLGGCGQKYWVPGVRSPLLVPIRFAMQLNNLIKPLNRVTATLVEAGRLSAEARQIMTKKAIRMGAQYILYIDDDTIPPEDGLYKLINFMDRHPTVGAVVGITPTRVDPPEPTVYKEHGVGAFWELPMGPGAVPQPIFGGGAAFTLARIDSIVDVISKMQDENDGVEVPIWADERTMPGDMFSEKSEIPHTFGHDVRFCRLLNKYGHSVYAHGDVQCGHLDIESDSIYYTPKDAPGFLGPRDLPKSEIKEELEFSEDKSYPSVDVIIVKYNCPELEKQTIEAVKKQTIYSNYQIIEHQNPKGVSLAKCWNDLIRQSDADYICLLNPDTFPAKGWLTKLMAEIVLPVTGAVVPSSNKVHLSQIDGPLDLFENNPEKINEFADTLKKETEILPQTASAMCTVFSKKIWKDIGGFDEDFQLYGEDTEFFWRLIRVTGKNVVWVKDSYVHHYKGQTIIKAMQDENLDMFSLRKEAAKLVNQKTNLEIIV